MKYCNILITLAMLCSTMIYAQGTADNWKERYNSTRQWRDKEDVINGWDWSLPLWVKPAQNSAMKYSRMGNKLVPVVVNWRELEPKEGEYNLGLLEKKINSALAKCPTARLMIMIYSSTWMKHFENGKSSFCSTPRWMDKYPWFKTKMHGWVNVTPRFRLETSPIYIPEFNNRYMKLLRTIGKSGILNRPKVGPVIIKGVSSVDGEEHGEPRPNTKEYKIWLKRLDAWFDMMGKDSYKLVSCTARSPWAGITSKRGAGTRSGLAERYLKRVENKNLGQYIDKSGFLCVDETVPMIAEERYSGDDNEEYVIDRHEIRYGDVKYWSHRYQEASLRMLQMRRNFVLRDAPRMNPNLGDYVALELGRTIKDTPDIWCYLRKSYLGRKPRDEARPVRHYERWLYNRDTKGYTPEYAEKVYLHHTACEKNRHPKHCYDYTARKTNMKSGNNAMSFDIDDRWKPDGPVYFKITYTDRGKGKLLLQYKDNNNKTHTKSVKCTNTGNIKTATFIAKAVNLKNTLGTARHKMDFRIKAVNEDITVNFVRLIKARRSEKS